ncbi:S-layer homology domain-containing protein [Paenibacillus senegalensis]|uniref:S-layer homology domain-containing protein n=1 Tax=Paenibacillus senegalensis TaxID=1465766 RepID=UPI000318A114|nr:S-layer homology domain-containing protein [Paenibacillus senegalensis]
MKGTITRIGVAAVLSGALLIGGYHGELFSAASSSVSTEKQSVYLSDITGHWAEDSIQRAIQAGYVDGYEDRTFRPDQNITRAEYAAMLAKALGVWIPPSKPADEHWYNGYVSAVVSAGFHRYSDFQTGTWDTPITRMEMARMAARAVDERLQSADDDTSDEEIFYIATQKGIINGLSSGDILGKKEPATRAQTVTVIQRILDVLEGKELEVDMRASSYAEVEWRGTNMGTMWGMTPVELPKRLDNGKTVKVVLNEVLVLDVDDPNRPYADMFPKFRRTFDRETAKDDYIIAMNFDVENQIQGEGYFVFEQWITGSSVYGRSIVHPEIENYMDFLFSGYRFDKPFKENGWIFMNISKEEAHYRMSINRLLINITNKFDPNGVTNLSLPLEE